MSLFINDSCIGCAFCQNECPQIAISFDGDKYRIDPEKCVRCGICSKVCLMDAIEDTDKPRVPMAPHDTIKKEADFVVVGGGAAGLVAAARYKELTGKRVIVLEKNRKAGGGGYFAVGFTPCNTQWEKDAGMPDCIDDKVRSAMDMTNWSLNKDLMTNLFTSLGELFDWLCTWAPTEENFQLAKNPFSGEMSVGGKDQTYGNGKFITNHILPRLRELGVEILTSTEATELVLDSTGAVAGVKARDEGGDIEISCTQCLLCTGSLINSQRIKDMVPQFADTEAKRYAHDMPTLTGDGLDMAEKAGIPIDDSSIVMAFVGCMPVAFNEGPFKMGERADCPRVNLLGQRWINEKSSVKILAERLMYQPKSVSYSIFDSAILESPEAQEPPKAGFGGPGGPGGGPGGPGGAPGGGMPYPGGVPDFAKTRTQPVPANRDAYRALAEELGQQTVICADTLEELAQKIGAPVETFVDTIKKYNEYCEAGRDADFLKPATYLRPVQEGPFFALRNYLYLDGVFGGLRVTPDMQVLGSDGPVPGLYAAGDITCGRYTNDLLHKTEVINDFSWALAGGFMAAKHAGAVNS